ncbi:MAG TPA: YHYH protein [Vicinamibacterales bacterium]|nr:YHYH protein [Vicinamibacterales bacterium]
MTTRHYVQLGSALFASAVVTVCGGSTATTTPTSPTTTAAVATSLPAIYTKFGNGTRVSLDGQTVIITATDVPDHPSPYFGVGNANYEAPQAGMTLAPGRIATQNLTFRIPLSPAKATPSDTPLGPMGVSVNGVALFNQYAAGRVPLGNEILSFDRFNGHPTPSNQYHYHVEPLWLTSNSKTAFIGVLLDGFPVYGPQDSGGATPTGLDGCNGHIGATADFSSGIYHYHITAAPPYIAGCFYGTPGTVTGG